MKRVNADCPKPSSSRRQQLDIPILSNIEPKQIKVWFQNRSIGNPYLLAENRHYTFYLWRKIINVHWSSKYLMVPHVYVWFSIFRILVPEENTGAGTFLGMCGCSNSFSIDRVQILYLDFLAQERKNILTSGHCWCSSRLQMDIVGAPLGAENMCKDWWPYNLKRCLSFTNWHGPSYQICVSYCSVRFALKPCLLNQYYAAIGSWVKRK
ncbi:hypothetical protein POM88_009821 [Heracleum sosnowskyi]|uniref:Dol-P-Glc:Glc(2)Man(9)GlcNAc(2)-PP-Dol alpha-1,2-glucosyltransferase n=1 Tax=Heracleum sosnowskyi TaxID=360622 RepID=A0AAD8JBA9_9APIA|nr:hypothetical protein POM88_009821 [Heracleum sosnowskyi]